MSNSSLISYTKISPNKNSPRNHKIDTITIHCVSGQCSIETLGDIFSSPSREASSNYGIGPDGRIGLYVDENDRSWCSSSSSNDNRAITIEVASDNFHPYKVTDAAYKSLINLLVDICYRNDIKELKWHADKDLIGQIEKQNMTVHRWFRKDKSCPGDYLYNLHYQIASTVNERLNNYGIVDAIYEAVSVNDIVEFVGTKQYNSANSDAGIRAVPGKVRVTQKYLENSKYPIHVRSVDSKGNYTSGTYGWVSIKDIKLILPTQYKVKVIVDSLNYRGGPSTSYKILGTIEDKGVYTIVQEKDGWGQLKSKVGWINLKYTTKI